MSVPADIWRYAIASDKMHTRGEGQRDKLHVPAVKVHMESAVGMERGEGEVKEE